MLIVYLLFLTLVNGCSNQLDCGINGNNCRGEPGATGPAGPQGPIGPRGEDGAVGRPGLGTQGPQGEPGIAGEPGVDGKDGQGCIATAVMGGVLVSCGLTNVIVLNGETGEPGPAGPAGEVGPVGPAGDATELRDYTPVAIVDPCGDTSGIIDEVFFRLYNGLLVASYSENSSGTNTRFAIIPPGNYQTTDTNKPGKRCRFSVDANNLLFNEYLY